jgi:hypothetical protein
VQVISSYAYRYSDNNSVNNSYGQTNSTLGSTDFTSQSTRESKSKSHNVNFEMDYSIDSANYLQITPTFSYSSSSNFSTSVTDNINNFTTGFEHPVVNGANGSLNTAPNYGATVLYQHILKSLTAMLLSSSVSITPTARPTATVIIIIITILIVPAIHCCVIRPHIC